MSDMSQLSIFKNLNKISSAIGTTIYIIRQVCLENFDIRSSNYFPNDTS